MRVMFRRASVRVSVALASFCLIAGCLALRAQDDNGRRMRKYKPPPAVSRIEVTVVRGYNGKPIPDAHVIFHPIEGDKDKGSLELKTNEDGKAIIEVIPIGDTVTLQVIANGFQTYGQVYKVDKPSMTMEVRMNRPTKQYSIYNNQASSGDKSGSGKDAAPGKDAGAGDQSGSGNNSDKSADKSTDKNSDSGKSPNSSEKSAPPASGDKPSGSPSESEAQPHADKAQPQPN
jgi:hypothetical protein